MLNVAASEFVAAGGRRAAILRRDPPRAQDQPGPASERCVRSSLQYSAGQLPGTNLSWVKSSSGRPAARNDCRLSLQWFRSMCLVPFSMFSTGKSVRHGDIVSCHSGQGSHRDGVIRNTTRSEPRVMRSRLNVSSRLSFDSLHGTRL